MTERTVGKFGKLGDERDLLGPGHALFATRLGPLDVLGVIEQGRGYDELMADAEEIDFRGHRIRILKLETLVALKRLSKDPRDRHRLPILEDVLRQLRGAAERDDNHGDKTQSSDPRNP